MSGGRRRRCTRRPVPARTARVPRCTRRVRRGPARSTPGAAGRRGPAGDGPGTIVVVVGDDDRRRHRDVARPSARESKRPIARPASTIWFQSWRATSSKPHHDAPAPVTPAVPAGEGGSSSAGRSARRRRRRSCRRRRRTAPARVVCRGTVALVAHSTSPATRSPWRRHISWAMDRPSSSRRRSRCSHPATSRRRAIALTSSAQSSRVKVSYSTIPRPWPRWSPATHPETIGERRTSSSPQFSEPVAVQPWSRISTGAPGGPAQLADERPATAGQPHVAPGRQPRCSVWLSLVPAHRNPSWCASEPLCRRP